jgi:hypothetical protein
MELPPDLPTRPGLFRPVRIDLAGRVGPTPNSARGPRWRASSHGFHVPATVEQTVDQRILEASMALPAHGGVTGWAGLRWGGGVWFDGLGVGGVQRPVWLATAGDDIRSQPGIAVSAERLDPRFLVVIDGVRMTVPVRSVDFELRYAEGLWHAVEVLDMAAYSDLVSLAEVSAHAMAHPGWTGIGQERAALGLADENSWSPQETWGRLVWVVVAELPPPLCNRPLFDRRGNFIGTPDLLDEEAGMVIEYEGVVHLDKVQRGVDVRREALFRSHGLEYVAVVAADHASPSALAARMHATRERARFASTASRSWTLQQPSWWRPTHTVDLRRQVEPELRAKLLGYRVA